MRRNRYDIFAGAKAPRYVVLWDLQWQVIEAEQLKPGSDLYGALAAAASRLKHEGWTVEGVIEYGFVFVNRGGERRLLALTERNPDDHERQTFSPH